MEITVTRGLAEMKLLKKRIESKINSTQFISGKKRSAKKIDNVFTVDEFGKEVKANYDSIVDLIERLKTIKSAIVKFNAEQTVIIADKEMTVADAIERKNNIVFEKTLLKKMVNQYNNIIAIINTKNEDMEQKLDRQIQTMNGGDSKKTDTEQTEAFSKSYRESNAWEIIDPLKLKDKINKLQEDIENFELNVDFVLSEKNSSNKIVIPD